MQKDELKQLIIDELGIADMSPAGIDDDAPLFGTEGLALDSLDAVELVVILKKRYGVNLQDIEVAKQAFRSINTLTAYLEGAGVK